MVAPYTTYVIVYCEDQHTPSCADFKLLLKADAAFQDLGDGNDWFALYHKPTGKVVDQIGAVGSNPGLGWTVAGVPAATRDHRLLRKPVVSRGNCGNWPRSAGTGFLHNLPAP